MMDDKEAVLYLMMQGFNKALEQVTTDPSYDELLNGYIKATGFGRQSGFANMFIGYLMGVNSRFIEDLIEIADSTE